MLTLLIVVPTKSSTILTFAALKRNLVSTFPEISKHTLISRIGNRKIISSF